MEKKTKGKIFQITPRDLKKIKEEVSKQVKDIIEENKRWRKESEQLDIFIGPREYAWEAEPKKKFK
ncbi:hypothetical protein J7K56_00445 [Candidatus Calescamantes bacterium]|nr:hypothetical protein [Candidatus Calescamantes bacterium]